ncbi:MAG: amino acid adenylation domain-containing protein [Bacteroidota bacterium]
MQFDNIVFTDQKFEQHQTYWKHQLTEFSSSFLFRQKRDKASSTDDLELGFEHTLSAKEKSILTAVTDGNDSRLYVCMFAMFAFVLKKYNTSEHLILHSPLFDPEGKYFKYPTDRVPLHLRIDASHSIRKYLNDCQNIVKMAYKYQGYPLDLLSKSDDPDSKRTNVLFTFAELHQELNWANIDEDLLILLSPSSKSYTIQFYYRPTFYEADYIQQLASHFLNTLTALTDLDTQLKDIQYLSHDDKDKLLRAFQGANLTLLETENVISLFEKHVGKAPHQIAVHFESEQLSYQQINQQANQLANYLMRKGGTPKDKVAICMGRSTSLMIGILGILKIGACYVPIDPSLPKGRVQYMLEDSKASFVLTESSYSDSFSEVLSTTLLYWDKLQDQILASSDKSPGTLRTLDSLCYIIYTSGSTGSPKGVLIKDGSLLNYVWSLKHKLELATGFAYASLTSISTDLGNTAVYPSLCLGGTLHLISKATLENPNLFFDYCQEHTIDLIKFTPSILNYILDENSGRDLKFRYLLTGGEAMTWDLLKKAKERFPEGEIYNHYGPTESTIGVSMSNLTEAKATSLYAPPIGQPLHNIQIHVLDELGHQTPIGVSGNLYIAGAGLAEGYLNQPALTEECFVPNPFEIGTLMYYTGDVGRWLSNGQVEFLRRADDQVKINGYRVEVGEIEHTLSQHPQIRQNVVIIQKDTDGTAKLIAYVIADESFDQAEVEKFLALKLPSYMIPRLWMKLEQLPLSGSGKVERSALPDIDVNNLSKKDFVAPRNGLEEELVKIWQTLLDVPKIGIYDNFFELGGGSLKLIQLMYQIRTQLGIKLELVTLMNNPTIEGISKRASNPVVVQESLAFKLNQFKEDQAYCICIPPTLGVTHLYHPFAQGLNNKANVYGIQFRGFALDGSEPMAQSVDELAENTLKEVLQIIEKHQLEHFYFVAVSFGVHVTFEVAKKLEEKGIAFTLILVDAERVEKPRIETGIKPLTGLFEYDDPVFFDELEQLFGIKADEVGLQRQMIDRANLMMKTNWSMMNYYAVRGTVQADAYIIKAISEEEGYQFDMDEWKEHLKGEFHRLTVASTHLELFSIKYEELVEKIGAIITA